MYVLAFEMSIYLRSASVVWWKRVMGSETVSLLMDSEEIRQRDTVHVFLDPTFIVGC